MIPYKLMMSWTKPDMTDAHTRTTTNDESSQLDISHDEGNKVPREGNDNHSVTSSGGNCDVTAFLRPTTSSLETNHTQSTGTSCG